MNRGLLPRLLRVQFTPIMAAPVVLGAALAWNSGFGFDLGLFLLVLVGSLCLHLAANGIDDVYDYLSGTDEIAERMFPPESPGWKPVARGMMSVEQAKAVAYSLYGVSIVLGLILSVLVGWYAMVIALPGIALSYFYTAPPLKLDYRGLGLGELSILASFGPIPALGAYYVLSGHLSVTPLIIALPSGMLTTAILISHDLIYFDVYRQAGKKSLAVVLGKKRASILTTAICAAAYLSTFASVFRGIAPEPCLLVVVAAPLFLRFADWHGSELSPPEYGKRTMLVFVHSVLFTLLLSAGFLVS